MSGISKVTGGGIVDGTLSVDDIADDAITADKLANSINTDIAKGPAALPKAGGTMTGTIDGFTSTGIDDNATSTAITINSSENVGIGTTNPLTPLQVRTQANANVAIQNSTSVAGGSKINCFNDAGNASAPFELDGSTLQFNIGSVEKMRVGSTGDVNVKTGNLVIGTAGKGIDFSATSDGAGVDTSSLLDDYEEGTWTPTDASGAGVTMIVQSCTYVKVGRVVHVYMYITFPTSTSNVGIAIGGLPYTARSDSWVPCVFYTSAVTTGGYSRTGNPSISIRSHADADYSWADFSGASYFVAQYTYEVA